MAELGERELVSFFAKLQSAGCKFTFNQSGKLAVSQRGRRLTASEKVTLKENLEAVKALCVWDADAANDLINDALIFIDERWGDPRRALKSADYVHDAFPTQDMPRLRQAVRSMVQAELKRMEKEREAKERKIHFGSA